MTLRFQNSENRLNGFHSMFRAKAGANEKRQGRGSLLRPAPAFSGYRILLQHWRLIPFAPNYSGSAEHVTVARAHQLRPVNLNPQRATLTRIGLVLRVVTQAVLTP